MPQRGVADASPGSASSIPSTFRVRVPEETRSGPLDAILPEVEGTAHITGRNELLIDPDDPLREGLLLR